MAMWRAKGWLPVFPRGTREAGGRQVGGGGTGAVADDLARTFLVEDGGGGGQPTWSEVVEAHVAQRVLHDRLRTRASGGMSLGELHRMTDSWVRTLGFENLDARGNFGHTLEAEAGERLFIEEGQQKMLGAHRLFTFRPHIRRRGGRWSFRHAGIYSVDAGGTIRAA